MLRVQSADEAEIVYYEAFMNGDIEVMSALWAEEDALCVHPGSGLISGRDAVLRSWRHILENARPIEIRYRVMHKTESDELAVHVVVEEILEMSEVIAVVIATNVFRKYRQGWQMIEHHSSIVQQDSNARTMQ